MKIDVAITDDNQESEICRFISVINKFNVFFTQIENIDNKTNNIIFLIGNPCKLIHCRHYFFDSILCD